MAYYRDYVMEPIYGQPELYKRERGFRDFALRHNYEFHWMDIGFQFHAIFAGAGAYFSPKEAVDFCAALINYPVALMRPMLRKIGLRPPEFDFSDDDTPSQIRKRQGQEFIPQEPGFEPAEKLNDWIWLPY